MENIVRKGELAWNKQFLLFSQCFLPYMARIFHFKHTLKMSSAICLNLDKSKILSSDNELKGVPLTEGNERATYVWADLALHPPVNKCMVDNSRIWVKCPL